MKQQPLDIEPSLVDKLPEKQLVIDKFPQFEMRTIKLLVVRFCEMFCQYTIANRQSKIKM